MPEPPLNPFDDTDPFKPPDRPLDEYEDEEDEDDY